MQNIIAEAAKSPLGIVALLFVIAGSLAHAFFGRETPVKIRVIMFVFVLAGLSGFAAAVLRINMPEPVVEVYGQKLPAKRAAQLSNLQDKFKHSLLVSQSADEHAKQEMHQKVEEANPFPDASNFIPVDEINLLEAESVIDRFKDSCNRFDEALTELKVDFPDMHELIDQRDKESHACRAELASLNQYLAKIKKPKY